MCESRPDYLLLLPQLTWNLWNLLVVEDIEPGGLLLLGRIVLNDLSPMPSISYSPQICL